MNAKLGKLASYTNTDGENNFSENIQRVWNNFEFEKKRDY
jgi:arginine utilization protein RocB